MAQIYHFSQTLSLIAKKIKNISKFFLILAVILNFSSIECKEDFDKDVERRLKIVDAIAGRGFSDVYQNGTFSTGNVLWDNILNKCSVKPSVSCLQNNFYTYLDDQLGFNGDVKVSSGVCFKKNNVDVNKFSKEADIIYVKGSKSENSVEDRSIDEENEIEDDEPETPLEEVTDALYDKGVKFLMTHDMRLQLPEMFFHGATLRISPRAFTTTGALVHVDMEPKAVNGEARLFFKRIKKYIKKKLVMAALAIILVIKLIALKLVFVLPIIFGVTTAKKMFLKLLLFLFPALSHIFKLCSWYHNNYHTTKYHHHHHLITHHHKYPHGPHHGHGGGHSAPYGPSLVVKPYVESGHPVSLDHASPDWELSGPGLGSEYIAAGIHRNAISNFKPDVNDINDINAWGLGAPPGPSMNVGDYATSGNSLSPNVATAPGNKQGGPIRPLGPPSPYYRNKKVNPNDPIQAEKEALIRAAALAARAPPGPVRDEILRVSAVKLTENNRIKTETDLVKQQQKILAAQDPETQAAEKFYGGLLEKVDNILSPLGASDLGCRERAVCALYQDPFKHSPYSNLVSNELSKDTTELLPPADSRNALLYYRYVQAARDGQEQKDCLTLYPNCNINYNKK